jgi:hypothetical protein
MVAIAPSEGEGVAADLQYLRESEVYRGGSLAVLPVISGLGVQTECREGFEGTMVLAIRFSSLLKWFS